MKINGKLNTISRGAFLACGFENITMEEGIEKIAMDALAQEHITSVIIPSSVTNIAYHSFINCTNLTSVEIKGKNVILEADAFKICQNITSLKIANDCTTLKWDATKNTLICSNNVVFIYPSYLNSLSSYSIPEGITYWGYNLPSNIKTMNFPKSLSRVEIVGLPAKLENITFLDSKNNFNGNSTFKVLTDDSNHKMLFEINNNKLNLLLMLYNTDKEINIPSTIKDSDGSIKNIVSVKGSAFGNVISGTNITINIPSIGDYAFGWGDNNDISIKLGANVINCSTYFCVSKYNYKLSVDSANTKYYAMNDQNGKSIALYEKNGDSYKLHRVIKKVTEMVIPRTVNNGIAVTQIGKGAFYGQDKLKKIDLKSTNITTIDSNAFEGCSAMNEIDISDKVTSIGSNCFANCSNLTIYIPTTKENNKIAGAPWGATKGDRAVKWASQ